MPKVPGKGHCHLYSNFNRSFCKQIVETLIRHHILLCLIWVCTVSDKRLLEKAVKGGLSDGLKFSGLFLNSGF